MAWSENDTTTSIPARFEQQVRARPNAPAIIGTEPSMSFSELDALANTYAATINRNGAEEGPPLRAAILLGHDGTQIAAVLAVLKRGSTAGPAVDHLLHPRSESGANPVVLPLSEGDAHLGGD